MSFHAPSLAALQTAPLQQHPAFGAALTHLGRPPIRVYLPMLSEEIQVLRRRFGPLRLGLISRGRIGPPHLERLRRETDCQLLLLNAETAGQYPGWRIRSAAHVAELALDAPASELRARMAQKWRNRLNKAADQGLKVSQTALPADPGHWLLRIDRAQQVVKRYRGYPPGFTAAFAAANRGQARLFELRRWGEPIAAMLFLCHGAVATYHIGWSGPEGRAASAHHLALWEAMIQLQARGITRIDLGQVDTETAPGLARFKLGSGALCRPLGGTWLVRL
ncbi:GNAT family N-acetyltransferase [Primorskyibacter aestuariivivens]|uniref:GNAT family N-acetyltransferase n=1 Tax=Primorskyibacter aestuariivivens TaxID=1888912 RepID=UPI002301EF3C|nr:GNAT family N-acetyltransferase [Primorskyibacter aestuariivivens]MDA7428510.1 GNAT family N-acetyltransferase [Primorskyibacter aestuariivivens]